MVYDCIEMRDGELMINSGVCNQECTTAAGGSKSQKLFKTGGLSSLLPILELVKGISMFNKEPVNLDGTVNDFLKLVVNTLQSRGHIHSASESETSQVIAVLFNLLTKLPNPCVNK